MSITVFGSRITQGGGYTNGGLQGDYYPNTEIKGFSAFSRKDVRIDFNFEGQKPGGSITPSFAKVPATGWSALWQGSIIPRHTENYTFHLDLFGGAVVRYRLTGLDNWVVLINSWPQSPQSKTNTNNILNLTNSLNLIAGTSYDIQVQYQLLYGNGVLKLGWSSFSTPLETIDCACHFGINNPTWSCCYTDMVKGARNSWASVNNNPVTMDANGWPTTDAAYVFQESLNEGLGMDPLEVGTISFSFIGQGTVSLYGNCKTVTQSYNAATNTTSGSFIGTQTNVNASDVKIINTKRLPTDTAPTGFTNLKLMKPVSANATTSYDPSIIFDTNAIKAYRNYTVIRHQFVATFQQNWSDRTTGIYFNQNGGTETPSPSALAYPTTGANGASWEYKILFANELGADIMISVPIWATGRLPTDTGSYLVNLANLFKYGSDGVNPYTSPQTNPVFPPLNSNLRVYLELENELWNWGNPFWYDISGLRLQAHEDAAANNADFQAFNYDNLPTTISNGEYTSMNTWYLRKAVLKMTQISNIFRSVFGDADMISRIRPLYEWQYANDNGTASGPLTWADNYFNKTDPASTYTGPATPVNYFLWGGGGASYYGAANADGLTTLLNDPDFGLITVSPGYNQNPTGSGWTFTGNSGIAQYTNGSDGIPEAYVGNQVGYIIDKGSMTSSFTIPTNQVSNQYAICFKAAQRRPTGSSAPDQQMIQVYIDYGTPNQINVFARSFSQGGQGHQAYSCPDASNFNKPWDSRVVSWTESTYYYTQLISAAPGSVHTVTIVGIGNPAIPTATNLCVFIGEVRVSSLDAFFSEGIPSGGEATGQPAGENIINTMEVEVNWAKAFGLGMLCYESGWSLGGDDGGSVLQNSAKFADSRTATAQETFIRYFQQAGGSVCNFGTYEQWPSWSDYIAQQGIINTISYPLVAGTVAAQNQIPYEPTNGFLLPNYLYYANAVTSKSTQAHGLSSQINQYGWLTWNIIATSTNNFQFTVSPTGTGTYTILLDEVEIGNGTGGSSYTCNSTVLKGLHCLKIKSTQGVTIFPPIQISVNSTGLATPTAPTVTVSGTTATVNWSAVPGYTGYLIRYGLVSGDATNFVDVGANTSGTIPGLTINVPNYFEIVAYNATSMSLPSSEAAIIPIVDNVTSTLGAFSTELPQFYQSFAPALPSISTSSLTLSPMTLGAGFVPSNGSGYCFRASANTLSSVGIADSVTKGLYYQFTTTPITGKTISLSQLVVCAGYSNGTFSNPNNQGVTGLQYSIDGINFITLTWTSVVTASCLYTYNLATETVLQGFTTTVYFRIVFGDFSRYSSVTIGLQAPTQALTLTGIST